MSVAALLAATLVAAAPEPPVQTLVFYNARLAARDGRPHDVLKLWLLHNSVAQSRGLPGTHDPDFLSLVWLALGDTGLCTDGLFDDAKGAGVRPVALHNWFVKAMALGDVEDGSPAFDAFDQGVQARDVSLRDVLSATELESVTFSRGLCVEPWLRLFDPNTLTLPDFKARLPVARVMRQLLREARRTLSPVKVQHQAAVDARIFDLDLMITELELREARDKARERNEALRELRLPPMQTGTFVPASGSEEGAILRRTLAWTPADWLTLSPERRQYLFARSLPLQTDRAALNARLGTLIDALIEQKAGAELEQWIGWLGPKDSPAVRELLSSGERGQRLLGLDRSTGFRERAVIALLRGVTALQTGDLTESLRSFAFAFAHADESRDAARVLALARRWLSFVLSRHETTDELLATLAALLPKHESREIVSELVWAAALNADLASFERCAKVVQGSGAMEARITRLRPLAAGKLTDFANGLRGALEAEPYATLRFTRLLVEKLEASDDSVRRAQGPTIAVLLKLLGPLSVDKAGGSSQVRVALELIDRLQAVLDGLDEHAAALTGPSALSPSRETFVGSVRLAPVDPLPWPFAPPEPSAPSVFSPLRVVPVEWTGADGALVMGFRIEE